MAKKLPRNLKNGWMGKNKEDRLINMNYKFEKWQDFNNISIKITIKGKTYNAILILDNNKLILKVNMSAEITEWRALDKKYDIISGKFLFDNSGIFLINCIHTGNCSSINCQNGTSDFLTADFIIERLILDKDISITSLNEIVKYSASYKNLDLFSESKPIIPNLKSFDYDANTHNYIINTAKYSMNILFYSSMEESRNTLSVNRMSYVEFNNLKSINIKDVIENIYIFRNFLMIMLKQPIYVKKQEIYINSNAVQLFDCSDVDSFLENAELEEMISHRCLKIDNIDNIEFIYNNFINHYDQLLPLLELYYNVTQYKVPNLTMFINATTMLEYYSRTFDFCSALALTKVKNNKATDSYYIDMIHSLLKNVNEVYNYNSIELDKISNNIKDARIHYIHYKTSQDSKILTYDNLFKYTHFIQDIVLLNIYKLLGLDISKYPYVSFNTFYYDKYDLI